MLADSVATNAEGKDLAAAAVSGYEAKLSLLPPDLQQLVAGLPRPEAEALLAKLVQATVISYRELTAADVAIIRASGDHLG
jgi:hypothetical protein